MGIFSRKKKEERECKLNYVQTWSDGLIFSEIENKYNSMNISAVYRAVEIISDSIAMLPVKVKKIDKNAQIGT